MLHLLNYSLAADREEWPEFFLYAMEQQQQSFAPQIEKWLLACIPKAFEIIWTVAKDKIQEGK